MLTTKAKPSITQQYSFDEYLKKLTTYCGGDEKLSRACKLIWDLPPSEQALPNGLEVALILADLSVDTTTLLVTLLGDFRLNQDAFIESIKSDYGEDVYHLVKKIR